MSETVELLTPSICDNCNKEVPMLFNLCECAPMCRECCRNAVNFDREPIKICATCGKEFAKTKKMIVRRIWWPVVLYLANFVIFAAATYIIIAGVSPTAAQQRILDTYELLHNGGNICGGGIIVVTALTYGVFIIGVPCSASVPDSGCKPDKSGDTAKFVKIYSIVNASLFILIAILQGVGCFIYWLLCGDGYPTFYTFGSGALVIVLLSVTVCLYMCGCAGAFGCYKAICNGLVSRRIVKKYPFERGG